MTELDALLILNASGIGNNRCQKIVDHFGSAQKFLSLISKNEIDPQSVPKEIVDKLNRFPQDEFLKKEYALLREHNVCLVNDQEATYPELLKNIADAPLVLYVKGNIGKFNPMSIAIVGSRRASMYGMLMAEKFAMDLAQLGIMVVSGMAKGIDTRAHHGALKSGGLTIAVLGCGLAHIYPPENKRLFASIADQGMVISEFSMATPPIAYNFPRRNRIISGLSMGVLVIEAFERSGALITSRLALEQGREVFALPGNIDTPHAKGTNHLIKQGAKLVTCVEEILEEIKPHLEIYLQNKNVGGQGVLSGITTVVEELPVLNDKENIVYQHISLEPIYIDRLVDQCAMSLSDISGIILNLELKKIIKSLPGRYYVRN